MALDRLVFPADRTAFVYDGPGQPITVPFNAGLQIFLDEACTLLADIRDIATEASIPNSTIYTADSGLFPEFYGPDAITARLWGKPVGGPAYPLDANFGLRLNAIADSVGIPVDGEPGQVLAKVSSGDFDTEWADQQVDAAHITDASPVGRQVLTAPERLDALHALGIYPQATNPSAGWGPDQAGFIWIKTPI